MIKINSLKLNIDKRSEAEELHDLAIIAAKKLRVDQKNIRLTILKKSIDARDKRDIHYIYNVAVEVPGEAQILKKNRDNNISLYEPVLYDPGRILREKDLILKYRKKLERPPVIVGFGPAGMLCALKLAEAGYKPIVIERGGCIEDRMKAVRHFWETGELNTECNVQFGEGGAGAFSDGKLNTMVSDPSGRIPEVFRVFVEHGASPKIAYVNKPHVGTDVLHQVVKSIREHIISLGGQILFDTCLKDIILTDGKVSAIRVTDRSKGAASKGAENSKSIECELLVLATGHSSRDTFRMLYDKGLSMEPKSFAVGYRVRHEQSLIGMAQYGELYDRLPAADYKLTYQSGNGRGVYSFCMCPGGYVVNASSEAERTCVNGMSYSGRNGKYADAAIVVTVNSEDFGKENGIFSGMLFQEKMEHEAFLRGHGKIPVQTYEDYRTDISSAETGSAKVLEESEFVDDNGIKGHISPANLRHLYPEFIDEAILEAMQSFGRKIKGFDKEDTLFLGVETRTSSPLRICRNEELVCENVKGIYPCGEGAGYAGGITSAAVDGIKVFEQILANYLPQG